MDDIHKLIKKESARQIVGIGRIAEHLYIDDSIGDIDCFPIKTDAELADLDDKLNDKIFVAQVVNLLSILLFKKKYMHFNHVANNDCCATMTFSQARKYLIQLN